MTTYAFEGFAVYYDNSVEEDTGAAFSGITLEIVVPESTTDFRYVTLPLEPGEDDVTETNVDTHIDDYTVRINGDTVLEDSDFYEGIFEVKWLDGGVARSTIVYIADFRNVNVPGLGVVDPQNIFVLSGDAFPAFTSLQEVQDLLDNPNTEIVIPTGAFAPGATIQLSSLDAVVTENDIITGDNDVNTFAGGGGNDLIEGLGGDDRLYGGNDHDRLNGGTGADVLSGGNGIDRAEYSDATASVRADLAYSGNNTGEAEGDTYFSIENLLGSSYGDILAGNNAANSVFGGNGNDFLIGRGGNDNLYGGNNHDRLNGGAGADVLHGGYGIDRAEYTTASTMVRADLGYSSNNTGEAAGDTYVSIENLLGSGYGDILAGNNAANNVFGGNGNDLLIGRGGNDGLYGGNNHDRLNGGAGADVLHGGYGIDRAEYTTATTMVRADLGYSSNNTGEAAGDTYILIENLLGSTYGDILAGNNAANNVFGGNGNDFLIGRGGNDGLYGGNNHDRLNGGAGADVLHGGYGIDRAEYTTATTMVRADLGYSSTNTGEAAGDTYVSIENLLGSSFDDFLAGNNAANSLLGGNGDDLLVGRGGNDRLYGGNNNDRLLGGTGNDYLQGGQGADVFIFDANSGVDTISDYDALDLIRIQNGAETMADFTFTDTVEGLLIEFGSVDIFLSGLDRADVNASDFDFV
ncbi:calcium-binding protein [Falsihalocynthiibacter sp. CO-5D18]|uniref:calcium-binding protein n=1 Tax=Falsihalocynthiibacter sp. CO-5D18 TaxID=3240872 RepID=UPI00350EB6BD